ncbi:carbohydrate ABC transporter permease [Paenibacillus mucilaginosus]|uniref:Binding-protein-dependent transport systems inner membrane component n=2 Tax=Paenibacillus mucilaginosus TaxID=61624 RepID=H6NET7_9BACL|nr:carbohydrate ABC transporter permease [Paenibacillus mucilaginosus]AEI39961.1 binding-protein-dependent transport systems inner membrane component [Paenibacillus mucilaginosus KNP414]AFC28628.1 binding-protein-dependent transport systems inner membrane component [Paenibacillus mucilaginosus 3016]MCG7216385.1 carbohydrate ABC transporter permease [Paenibacillus mucilaginosus]WDM29219.1 carbohydrate ABC transporter permease [Paenibacillus mucilaginosus]WFA17407.1 carbohydrate ABC transporter 
MNGGTAGRKWLLDVLMLPFGLLTFFPFYLILINTVKTPTETAINPMSLPKNWDFSNYIKVFEETPLLRSFGNSLFITVISVLLMVLIGAMAAYPVVYNPNRLNKVIVVYLLAGFLIPFQTTLIPLFELMTDFGLINKLWGLIILYMGGAVFVFFLVSGYMRTLPKELSEAAIIDGCSVWGVFWRIILPLLQPITMTSIIYQTMWIWNDFLAPMLFLNSQDKATLVLQVYKAKGEFSVNWPLFMTLTVIVLVPIFIFFLFMQKHIVKGIVGGAIKG